jgi:hypothetical protein
MEYVDLLSRRLLCLVLIAWLSGCGATAGTHARELDNRRLQTDIAVICHDLSTHTPGRGDLHARLRVDANGLIRLFRHPDTRNPRRDTRRSIELAIEDLKGCDGTVATQLRSITD